MFGSRGERKRTVRMSWAVRRIGLEGMSWGIVRKEDVALAVEGGGLGL